MQNLEDNCFCTSIVENRIDLIPGWWHSLIIGAYRSIVMFVYFLNIISVLF